MNWKFWEKQVAPIETQEPSVKAETGILINSWGVTRRFDGEKNLGEMGPAINYVLDHEQLSVRSWQAYLESDIAKTVIDKYITWVIDGGLRLKTSPNATLLKQFGIEIKTEETNEIVEALFETWSSSKRSSYDGMSTLNEQMRDIYKHAKIGGDGLVVLRYEKGNPTVQFIDGSHLCTPRGRGILSRVKNGVELNEKGEHVGYWVRSKKNTIDFIPAWNKSAGMRTAFLVYGSRFRSDNKRGIPVIATVLESIKKIERYREATIGSAEERAKIVYQIVHGVASTGIDPRVDNMLSSVNYTGSESASDLATDDFGAELARTVAVSTNKQTFNMPKDSQLKSLDSTQELSFKEFFETNAHLICSSIGIPPDVAFSMYNGSFSASRAATKDWDHTLDVERKDIQSQFLQYIYNFFLYVQVLNNRVQMPGYLSAKMSGNWMVIEAYQRARFTGRFFPHIDPLKEVKAEREKLGTLGTHIPLTTVEQACEVLGTGDSDSNMDQFSEELKEVEKLGIIVPKKEEAEISGD